MSRYEPLIGPVDPPGLHVMTFNVRRRLGCASCPPADRWRVRAPRVRTLMGTERPTLIGLQEALPDQAALVRDALGPAFRLVGHGRSATGRGEGCPIVYDAERLQLVHWSQQALSDRPDSAGSRTWGNPVPRVLVAAVFTDRSTAHSFTALNTHLDPLSRRSRERAAARIRDRAVAAGTPVVVTGDLNSGASSAPVRTLTAGTGALRDAWVAASARLTPHWGTYARYRTPRPDGARIDWILVSQGVTVDRSAINAGRIDGGWPSDHLPVQTVVRIAAEQRA
ncbi:endonuclease/exonuclease/phosphatase family protein [Microbacterium gallinarum]|nr:endonuclease/exonuclease/phosphatase family protein [Microbacterium gallinarum]